jgi:hypothetical protein
MTFKFPANYNNKSFVHAWAYRNATGEIIGYVARYQNDDDKKDIVPFFKREGDSFAIGGVPTENRTLFGLELLSMYGKTTPVFIHEGEKAAQAMQNLNFIAITSLGGSNAAKNTDWSPLNGFSEVILIPDNDEAGEYYLSDVAQCLANLEQPPILKILCFPSLQDIQGADFVDWVKIAFSNWNEYDVIFYSDTWHTAFKAKVAELVESSQSFDYGSLPSNSESCEWDTPNSLQLPLKPVPLLPLEIIPTAYRAWIADISHRMQTPPDFSIVTALVVTGSLIGSGCAMRPKKKDNWEVFPNVWGGCIGRPSVVLKTPSMREPMVMLDRLQAEAGKQHEIEKKYFDFDNEVYQAAKKSLRSNLEKAVKGNFDDQKIGNLRREFMDMDEVSEPVRRLFKTNETSVQSMTVLQKENPRGILVFRDELVGLLTRWDREDMQDERAYFLEGWNGNGSYTDKKIGRGLTEAENICISILGGIQPDKLNRYIAQTLNGNNDGLLQRFQLAVYPDEPKNWQLIDSYPNTAEKNRVFAIMQTLADMDFTLYGATKGESNDKPHFHFSEEAQLIFNNWLTTLQLEKLPNEENPFMCEHLGKYRSLMPSLSLIFHLIDIADGNATGDVSAPAANLAVTWCDYLEAHARRIYSMSITPEREAALILARHIKKGDLPNPFIAKNVYDKTWQLLRNKEEVEAACRVLEDENWLRMERQPKNQQRGRPLIIYQINPQIRGE